MWKNTVELGRPQMTIWCVHIACWIPKTTNRHSEYIIPIVFPLQQWLHKSVQCYVIHTLCVLQASILVESGSSATNITSNGHHKNGIFPAAGYTNAAFVGSTTSLGVIASAATRPKPTR